MSLFLLISDLHAYKWAEFSRVGKNGVNDRLVDCLKVMDWANAYADGHKIDHIIFTGDLFHKREIKDVETEVLVYRRLTEKWWLIPGNHDQATLDGRIHSLESFNRQAHVIRRPCIHVLAGVRWGFVPYIHDPDVARPTFKDLAPDCDYLACHAAVQGAVVGSYEYRPKTELRIADVIGKKPPKITFSGHYHRHQVLADGKFVYVGAPLQHVRSDAGQATGMILLDTRKGKWTRVLNTFSPRFESIDISKVEHSINNKSGGVIQGNFIDLIADHIPPNGFDSLVSWVTASGARGVYVDYTPKGEPGMRLRLKTGASLDSAIRAYVRRFHGKLDTKRLIKIGRRLLG